MYKIINSTSILRLEDGAIIPDDEKNSDYIAYLKWAKDNVIEPADIPLKVFSPLSPAQVRLVLEQFGLLASVEAAVALGTKTLQVEWEFRNEFARDNTTLLIMAAALGMTTDQVDNMFNIGITL